MTALGRRLAFVLFLLVGSVAAIGQETAPPPKFQISADKLAAYIGQYAYDDDLDLIRSISLEGSRLFMESARTRKAELFAESEDTFTVQNGPVKFKFLRSPEGKIIGFNRVVAQSSSQPERTDHEFRNFSPWLATRN